MDALGNDPCGALSLLLIPSAAEILGFPTDGGQCEQSDAYGKLLQNPSVARADGINRRDR